MLTLPRYPNIIDAPSPFLENRDNCTAAVQEVVNKLQRAREVQEKFKEHPDYRRAYYYKRAWAIAWGYFNSKRDAEDIFELCDDASIESNGDFSSIVSKFVDQWRLHYPLALKYQSNDWNQLLSDIEAEPLHRKLDYPFYLQVTVLYTSSSNLKGGEWLEMVERKLEWLKDSKCCSSTQWLLKLTFQLSMPASHSIKLPERFSKSASGHNGWCAVIQTPEMAYTKGVLFSALVSRKPPSLLQWMLPSDGSYESKKMTLPLKTSAS
jgi:hypothetical protein